MATGKPVSGRAVRRAVGDSVVTLNVHAKALRANDAAIGVLTERADTVEDAIAAVVSLLPPSGVWRRLVWLVRG